MQRNLASVWTIAGLVFFSASARALDWQSTSATVAAAPFQETLDVVFAFRNSGPKPVTIRNVETSCGCLEATTDRNSYPPGATGTVNARFTIGDRTGHYARTIVVVTDEPSQATRLVLEVEVPKLAEFTPRSVTWDEKDAGTEKTLELLVAPDLAIDFADPTPTSEAFAARLETVEAGKHYRLYLKPRRPGTAASAAIRVSGRDKSGHEVVVSAYASVP